MLEPIEVVRVVATPEALDNVTTGTIVLRTAPDEALFVANEAPDLADPHAIVIADTGWWGGWLSSDATVELFSHHCRWQPPDHRPAFAQGMVAGLPVKVWLEEDRTLIVTLHAFAHDLSERMGAAE